MARITFRRKLRYDAMVRLPEMYHANENGNQIATIQRDRGGEWFWYGDGYNSLWFGKPKSLEECKAEIKARFSSKQLKD